MSAMVNQALNGAVALVTGARGGIGRAICEALGEAGARVVATGTGEAPADLAVDVWLRHDVTSEEDWTRVVTDVGGQFGHLDCLVNNAAIPMIRSITDTSLQQWRRVMSVNVESIFLGLQALLPLLREGGKNRAGGSSVVNVSSVAGLRSGLFSAAYSSSKAAVTVLSKSAAREFAALGYPIRVNSIHPGVIETRMLNSVLDGYVEVGLATTREEQMAAFRSMTPLRRIGRPEEIAGGVLFLCSAAASFMTGSELVIDGGVIA